MYSQTNIYINSWFLDMPAWIHRFPNKISRGIFFLVLHCKNCKYCEGSFKLFRFKIKKNCLFWWWIYLQLSINTANLQSLRRKTKIALEYKSSFIPFIKELFWKFIIVTDYYKKKKQNIIHCENSKYNISTTVRSASNITYCSA